MCYPQYVNRVLNPSLPRQHSLFHPSIKTGAMTGDLRRRPFADCKEAQLATARPRAAFAACVTSAALGYLLPPGHDAAVDGQDDAGDPLRLIRGEKQQALRGVLGLAVAA